MSVTSDLHTLSGAYALDALAPDEAREFERHMAECPACRDEVRELREAAASMGASEAATPPATLKSRVMQAARRQPQLPPLVDQSPRQRSRRRLWALVGAAAAVLALIAGAVTSQVLRGPQLAQPVAAVFQAPDVQSVQVHTSNGGTLKVAVSRDLNQMAVDTHQLPQLSKAQVYQLWTLAGGPPRSDGLVKDPQAGRAMPMPARTARVAITIEPAGGSRQPTTQPIVVLRPSQV